MDLISGQWAVYSETFPASGMTRNGELYEHQTSERRTNDPACSSSPAETELLRTPCAAETEGGPLHPETARARRRSLRLTGQILATTGDLLPTPTTNLGDNGGSQDPEKRRSGGHSVSLQDVAENRLLPTPRTSDTNGPGAHGTGGLDLRTAVTLLPAPKAADGEFGEYTPAIRRWEQVIGRPAPPPTESTGKNGAHRLSARFVEWMMGLPDGWVTGILKRRAEALKALGNGVVPQQAAYALADMRAEFEAEERISA